MSSSRPIEMEEPDTRTQLSYTGQTILQTMERSVATVRHIFGESHRYYADSLDHYAKALEAMGKTSAALETTQRAREVRAKILERETNGAGAWNAVIATRTVEVQPRVLDAQAAARYLSLGLDTLYRLVRSGELPHSRIGKSIRFRPEDLDEYIAARVTREWSRVDKRGRPKRAASESAPTV